MMSATNKWIMLTVVILKAEFRYAECRGAEYPIHPVSPVAGTSGNTSPTTSPSASSRRPS
jgi:hypothetical protein